MPIPADAHVTGRAQLTLFDPPLVMTPVTALSPWRLCLPCAFGQRAAWAAPGRAIGWLGRDHCYFCATYTGQAPAVKKCGRTRAGGVRA